MTQLLGRPHGDVVMIPAVDRLSRDTTDLLVTRPRHAARRGGPAFAGCLSLITRYCPYEAFYLGLIVVVMHAGADERVEATRRQVETGRARRTRDVDIDVPCAQPGAGLIRRLAIFHKGDDAASLHAEISAATADTRAAQRRSIAAGSETHRLMPRDCQHAEQAAISATV